MQITLINKNSFNNSSGSRCDFDLPFLQGDAQANPNHDALSRNEISIDNWIDCSKIMYVLEWDSSDFNTYAEFHYSRSSSWLEKNEFESGAYQHTEDKWNKLGRLDANRTTKIFNLICSLNSTPGFKNTG